MWAPAKDRVAVLLERLCQQVAEVDNGASRPTALRRWQVE